MVEPMSRAVSFTRHTIVTCKFMLKGRNSNNANEIIHRTTNENIAVCCKMFNHMLNEKVHHDMSCRVLIWDNLLFSFFARIYCLFSLELDFEMEICYFFLFNISSSSSTNYPFLIASLKFKSFL